MKESLRHFRPRAVSEALFAYTDIVRMADGGVDGLAGRMRQTGKIAAAAFGGLARRLGVGWPQERDGGQGRSPEGAGFGSGEDLPGKDKCGIGIEPPPVAASTAADRGIETEKMADVVKDGPRPDLKRARELRSRGQSSALNDGIGSYQSFVT